MSTSKLLIMQAQSPNIPRPTVTLELNPITLPDYQISNLIIGIHDYNPTKWDVDSLFCIVSNIVKRSPHISRSLGPKRSKAVELVEDKVPQSSFMPPFSTFKEIACEMTCKPFSTSAEAHQTIVGILGKLRSYSWDAKAVIALSAFALDYGETWRFSLMETINDIDFELHLFRFGEEDKPSQEHANLISSLVDDTLELIEGILKLEKMRADKTYSRRDVPALHTAHRDYYTYWAIFALLFCANRKIELDWTIKSEVVGKLKYVLMRLNKDLAEIQRQIDLSRDLAWRLEAFHSPSGILLLLKALIFREDIQELQIFEYPTQTQAEWVREDEIVTKNLLLFISGLDNIEAEISVLNSIHVELKKKQNYQILWVPIGKKYDDEEKQKFKKQRSQMPWYLLQELFEIKGKRALEMEWHYQGKPMVVVVNTRGEVVHMNALYMIYLWKMEAFPFEPEVEHTLFLNWNWYWNAAITVSKQIINPQIDANNYFFIYGGIKRAVHQDFVSHIKEINNASIVLKTFDLGTAPAIEISEFWKNINMAFLSRVQKENFEGDSVLIDIQTVLSYQKLHGWAVLSKGKNVIAKGHHNVMANVLIQFKEWILGGKKGPFQHKEPRETPRCYKYELTNVGSRFPISMACFEPSCHQSMEIEVIKYKCCHGLHTHHAQAENGEDDSEGDEMDD